MDEYVQDPNYGINKPRLCYGIFLNKFETSDWDVTIRLNIT